MFISSRQLILDLSKQPDITNWEIKIKHGDSYWNCTSDAGDVSNTGNSQSKFQCGDSITQSSRK